MLSNHYKLKWRLLAGFFICALITGAGSAIAIWALNSTYSDMQATSAEIAKVIDQLNEQSQLESGVRDLINQIQQARRLEALKRCEEKLAQIKTGSAGDNSQAQDDVLKAAHMLIAQKQKELDASDASRTTAEKTDDLITSMNREATRAADAAEKTALTPTSTAADVLVALKAAQRVQLACRQLDAELKETLLSADAWLLNEQAGRLRSALAALKTEIAKLPDNANKKTLDEFTVGFGAAVDGLIVVKQKEFETRRAFLNESQSLSELVSALSESIQQNAKKVKGNVADQLQRNSATVARWSKLQGILGIVSLILAISFGIAIANSVTKDLAGVVDAMTRTSRSLTSSAKNAADGQLANADLTQRLAVDGRDEIAILARSYNSLIESFLALVQQIQHSGTQMAAASNQIASSTRQLEAAMAEQTASTNEVAATSKEISATSQALVTTMNEVSTVATATAGLAGAGKSDLSGMETTMGRLAESTAGIASRLSTINDRAARINTILVTITKLADQTNLLSLNASIEAEKAGDHGLGFAVVAREVRRLADQSARCTEEIERFIKDMQSAVSAGVMEMDKFTRDVGHGVEEVEKLGGQLATIISQVETLAPRFATVNEGMQAQSIGAKQISTAMLQLSDAALQTMDALRTTSTATQELNSAAQGLRDEVKRFKTTA